VQNSFLVQNAKFRDFVRYSFVDCVYGCGDCPSPLLQPVGWLLRLFRHLRRRYAATLCPFLWVKCTWLACWLIDWLGLLLEWQQYLVRLKWHHFQLRRGDFSLVASFLQCLPVQLFSYASDTACASSRLSPYSTTVKRAARFCIASILVALFIFVWKYFHNSFGTPVFLHTQTVIKERSSLVNPAIVMKLHYLFVYKQNVFTSPDEERRHEIMIYVRKPKLQM